MRYYSNGSLADLLSREQQLSLTLKLQMALDIARGMAYLHARPNGQVSAGGTALVLWGATLAWSSAGWQCSDWPEACLAGCSPCAHA